jgi:hypothetical protein
MMIYQFIAVYSNEYCVALMCSVLEVSVIDASIFCSRGAIYFYVGAKGEHWDATSHNL